MRKNTLKILENLVEAIIGIKNGVSSVLLNLENFVKDKCKIKNKI